MWDGVKGKIDPTLIGFKSVKSLRMDSGAKELRRLEKARQKVFEAETALTRARASGEAGAIDEAAAVFKAAGDEEVRLIRGSSEAFMKRPKIKKAEDYLYTPGSDERRLLEALRLAHRNRMASVSAQVATDAAALRESSRQAVLGLTDRLKAQGLIPLGREDEFREAIESLSEAVFGRDIDVKLASKEDLSAEILLKGAVSRVRKKTKDPVKRAELLRAEIGKIQVRLAKVGSKVIGETELGKAVEVLTARRGRAAKEPVKVSDEVITKHIDEFLDKIKDATFDLRHINDNLRGIEGRLTAAFNNLETDKALFRARLKALQSADIAAYIPNLKPDQVARISALLKNPLLRNAMTEARLLEELAELKLVGAIGDIDKAAEAARAKSGPVLLLKKTQARLAAAKKRLDRYIESGNEVAIAKQRENVAKLEEHVRILGSEEEVGRIVAVAGEMQNFFDIHLRRQKELGIIDEAFDKEAFFARVDVAAYFPHILSEGARKRADAFGVGTGGRIGRTLVQYFGKERKLAGVIEDINEGRRAIRAEKILHQAAKNGLYGEGAARAAAKSRSALRGYFEKAGQKFDDLIEEIKEGALLAEFDELFETDPLVAMEYYHKKVSEAVADARFINTIIDLFPTGRFIAEIADGTARMEAAERLGYAPLGEVEYLQAVLQKKLPTGLKSLAPQLKQRVIEGAKLDEIKALIVAEIGEEIPTEILAALTSPKMRVPYVPIQVKEYLNWRNSADAALAKKTVGTDVWDGMQAWAKTQATIIALAHIGRNFIGNTISLLQEVGRTALNPVTQFQAMRIWGSWGDESLDAVIKLGNYEMSVRD